MKYKRWMTPLIWLLFGTIISIGTDGLPLFITFVYSSGWYLCYFMTPKCKCQEKGRGQE